SLAPLPRLMWMVMRSPSRSENLQRDDLTDSKASGVGRGQQHAIAGMNAGIENAPDLFATEQVGQLLRLLGRRDVELGTWMAEGDVVEKAERMGGLGTRAPGPFPHLE